MVSSETDETQNRGAPGELELIREFVNTVDIEDGEERLTSPEALAAWLEDHGTEAEPRPGAADLEAAAERASVRLGVDGDGRVSVLPSGGGVDGFVARLLEIVARSQVEGTWARLKACPDETCAWAFYDESRNSSRTWCSMGVCGNRAKTRRYRKRRRERPAA